MTARPILLAGIVATGASCRGPGGGAPRAVEAAPPPSATATAARARRSDPLVINDRVVDPDDGHTVDRVPGARAFDLAWPAGPGRYRVAQVEIDVTKRTSQKRMLEAEITDGPDRFSAAKLVRREDDGRRARVHDRLQLAPEPALGRRPLARRRA
jgi:hypothetical protein